MTLVVAINEGWRWSGIEALEVHAVSPFGHVLFTDADGAFHHLDPDGLRIIQIGSRQAADVHFASEETRAIWLAPALVNAARERLGEPQEGYVFSLEPHALLEGRYEDEAVRFYPHEELIRLSGRLARQLKDVPDGTHIQLKVDDL